MKRSIFALSTALLELTYAVQLEERLVARNVRTIECGVSVQSLTSHRVQQQYLV
jgi:hypothetical protein